MNKFKNSNGVFYTQGLFYETAQDRENVIYTLKDHDLELSDGTVLLSLKRLYLDFEDTTEYEFANKYLGGWPHWQRLSSLKWFEDHVKEWRTELELKLKARSIRAIRSKAEDPDTKEYFSANKYLIDKEWVGEKRVGRPTKQSIKEEAARMTRDQEDISEDHARIIQLKRD